MLKRRVLPPLISLLMLSACHDVSATGPTTSGAISRDVTSTSAVQQEFKSAIQRVRQREPDGQDSPALKRNLIYDYLVSARLRRDLDTKPGEDLDAVVDSFVQAHDSLPVVRNLKNDWLASLAARQRWDLFLPRAADVSTPALICERLKGRIVVNDIQGLDGEALARWSLPQKQPADCDPVFAWLRQHGFLTPALAEARTRAALAAGNARFAREAVLEVPTEKAAPLIQWAQLIESPKSALNTLASLPNAPVEPGALAAGFERLSRSDLPSALVLLPSLLGRSGVNDTLKAKLRRTAALGAAYSRNPAALSAFDDLQNDPTDNDVQEWRVRAALWAGDYRKALAWMEQMSATLAAQPRWRYWHARAVAATSGAEAAAPLFAEIAGLRDFYGYLAADHLNRDYLLNAHASPDDPGIQATLAAEPGLIRAHALFDCDMDDEAIVEWAVALSGASPAVKVQAAQLAARWGWYAQSITTLAQVGEFDDVRLRYPRPYSTAIAQASKLTQVPSDWILAVMRQESLFRDDAVSRAGARGLMQMQPATAAAVSRRWHLPAPERDGSFDPAPDVVRGAAYLRDLLDKYGQLGLTLAAYNAGPAPVARWMPTRPMDADVWVENIPYGETRSYVQRIVEHIVAFAWVRDAELPRVTVLLPKLEPAAQAARR